MHVLPRNMTSSTNPRFACDGTQNNSSRTSTPTRARTRTRGQKPLLPLARAGRDLMSRGALTKKEGSLIVGVPSCLPIAVSWSQARWCWSGEEREAGKCWPWKAAKRSRTLKVPERTAKICRLNVQGVRKPSGYARRLTEWRTWGRIPALPETEGQCSLKGAIVVGA